MELNDVVEFFNSWQGEGPRMGQRATFIRFKKCNKNCIWCDTIFKIKDLTSFKITTHDVLEKLSSTNYLVFTGGEPLLYIDQIIPFLKSLYKLYSDFNYTIGFETNGTQLVKFFEQINHLENRNIEIYCSPKVFTKTDIYEIQDILTTTFFDIPEDIKNSFYIKLVIDENIRYDELLKWLIFNNFPKSQIYLMPEGRTSLEILLNTPKVLDIARKYDVNVCSRLHILGAIV